LFPPIHNLKFCISKGSGEVDAYSGERKSKFPNEMIKTKSFYKIKSPMCRSSHVSGEFTYSIFC
jgi:hypothetical protein